MIWADVGVLPCAVGAEMGVLEGKSADLVVLAEDGGEERDIGAVSAGKLCDRRRYAYEISCLMES